VKNKLIACREIACIVLLLCFFLPLSKCSETQEDGSITSDYIFAFDHFTVVLNEVSGEPAIDVSELPLLLVTLVVFFVPAALWKLKPKIQASIQMTLAIPAEGLLYDWATVGDPQIGGVLAILCWLVLFIIALMQIWRVF
jgi:hypothetical protein